MLLLLLAACPHPAPPEAPPAAEAPPAPPVEPWSPPASGELRRVDEAGLRSLARNPTGRVLVLNVWASWCAPCVHELPELGELARVTPGVEFVLINVDPSEELARHPAALGTGLGGFFLDAEDSALTLARTFPTWNEAIPFTVVVTPDGRVSEAFFGRFERERLESAIREAAGATAP